MVASRGRESTTNISLPSFGACPTRPRCWGRRVLHQGTARIATARKGGDRRGVQCKGRLVRMRGYGSVRGMDGRGSAWIGRNGSGGDSTATQGAPSAHEGMSAFQQQLTGFTNKTDVGYRSRSRLSPPCVKVHKTAFLKRNQGCVISPIPILTGWLQ